MYSHKVSTRDLILLPALIVICSLTFAQDPVTSTSRDIDADPGTGLENGDKGEDAAYPDLLDEGELPELPVEKVTPEPKPYLPESANVYPAPKRENKPPFHYAVWDESGSICILAKFDASFTVTYNTRYGKQQMIDRLDPDATVDGRCESFLDEKPVLDLKWRGGFTFRVIFKKVGSLGLFSSALTRCS